MQVRSLEDVAIIEATHEVVIDAHVGYVVVAAGHERCHAEVGTYLIVVEPEHGVLGGLAAEVATAVQHGADGSDAGGVGSCTLVVERAFLDEVAEHLTRGDVAVGNGKLAVLLLVVDVELVEHVGHLVLVVLGEELITVGAVRIGRHLAIGHEADDEGEEVAVIEPINIIFE